MGRLNFFLNFIKDWGVASITPSSGFAVKKLSNGIDFGEDIVIVEYGAGNGVFTKYFLNKMTNNSKLIAIETNKQLCNELNKIKDGRLLVFNESAENIKNILKRSKLKEADYIVSGIPFSHFDDALSSRIVRNSKEILADDGKFLVYQFLTNVKKHLVSNFGSCKQSLCLLNIPPLLFFEVKK